jgi:predicted phosphodiesterase
MKLLIVSDIHGNLPALEFVLQLEKDADLVVSLGDVVNYGPWSNECVDLLESLSSKVLLCGNHEEAFISGQYPGSNKIARAFFDFCYPFFKRKEAIARYDKTFSHGNVEFVHTVNDSYIFPDTELELNRNVCIGHSHRGFKRIINGYRLVNVGSVGQNRENIDELNYATWQPEKGEIEVVTREFKADALLSEMRLRNYPAECINYILSKRK